MKTVDRANNGDDCMHATHCECGAPVTVTPVAWKKGEPVEWQLKYEGTDNDTRRSLQYETDNFMDIKDIY